MTWNMESIKFKLIIIIIVIVVVDVIIVIVIYFFFRLLPKSSPLVRSVPWKKQKVAWIDHKVSFCIIW